MDEAQDSNSGLRVPYTWPFSRRERFWSFIQDALENVGKAATALGYVAIGVSVALLAIAIYRGPTYGAWGVQQSAAAVGWAAICAVFGRALMRLSTWPIWRQLGGESREAAIAWGERRRLILREGETE